MIKVKNKLVRDNGLNQRIISIGIIEKLCEFQLSVQTGQFWYVLLKISTIFQRDHSTMLDFSPA